MYVVPTAIIGKGPSVAVHGVSVYCNRQGRFKSSVLLHRVSRHIAADVSKDRCALYEAALFGLLDATDKDNRSLHVCPSASLLLHM